MSDCSICNKPVLPQQGIHGVSGDHWDCWEARLYGILGYDPRATFNAVAAGGARIHRVNGNTSICGHTPKDCHGSSMRRARWIKYDRDVNCPHCLEAMRSTDGGKQTP